MKAATVTTATEGEFWAFTSLYFSVGVPTLVAEIVGPYNDAMESLPDEVVVARALEVGVYMHICACMYI